MQWPEIVVVFGVGGAILKIVVEKIFGHIREGALCWQWPVLLVDNFENV